MVRPDGAALEILRASGTIDEDPYIEEVEERVHVLGQLMSDVVSFNVNVDQYLLNIEGRMQVVVREGDRLGAFAIQSSTHIENTFKQSLKVGCEVEDLHQEFRHFSDSYSRLHGRFNALQGEVGTLSHQVGVFGESLNKVVNVEIENYKKKSKIRSSIHTLQSRHEALAARLSVMERRISQFSNELDTALQSVHKQFWSILEEYHRHFTTEMG